MVVPHRLRPTRILKFWFPLAATWLMMSVEGPLAAALIARLDDATHNLAAYGVAFSFALIVEAPVIMLMSAATALARDRQSFLKLRSFTLLLITGTTLAMVLVLVPPIFRFLAEDLIGLPPSVAQLTHRALLLLLPWPGAIGYRRLYQGLLIREDMTRRVAYGTLVRLAGMGVTAFLLYSAGGLPGAMVGAAALSSGVCCEALASRAMAVPALRRIETRTETSAQPLSLPSIASFYYPLALTSLLGLASHPMITFFVGQSRLPIESLAVLPVVNSLVFIFRSLGLAYQEAAIALIGDDLAGEKPVRDFAFGLMGFCTIGISLAAFTPLGVIWYQDISGLSATLTALAIDATRVLTLMPALTVLLCFQRAILVNLRRTRFVTMATGIEVTFIGVVLLAGIRFAGLTGAVAAALAMMIGRSAANAYLVVAVRSNLARFRNLAATQ